MNDFDYAAPRSVDEALEVLAGRRDEVRFLAGGTDIIVQLREGLRRADLVVDLKKIPELLQIAWTDDGGLRIGAAAPCHRLYRDARIRASFPALTDAARIIGGWQIQSRASIGGNLCNSSPAADSIPALMALGATAHIAGAGGRRSVAVEDFCTAPGRNVLERGEFVVAIELPAPKPGSGSHYRRFIPRNEMDIAVVGSGVWLALEADGETVADARIALAAVAPTPVSAPSAASSLRGKPASEETLRAAGELAKECANPISDLRGPATYRRHLVGVLTRRALSAALERARDNLNGQGSAKSPSSN